METFNIPGMNFRVQDPCIGGVTVIMCRMGLVRGRNLLMKAGFQLNPRRAYYEPQDRTYIRGDLWAGYNSITKEWFLVNLNR